MTSEGRPESRLFRRAIKLTASEYLRNDLTAFADWADELADQELCRLESRREAGMTILDPGCKPSKTGDDNSIAIGYVYNKGEAQVSIHWSVAERNAPKALPRIEKAAKRTKDDNKNLRPGAITPKLLDALTEAYREAAGKGD